MCWESQEFFRGFQGEGGTSVQVEISVLKYGNIGGGQVPFWCDVNVIVGACKTPLL